MILSSMQGKCTLFIILLFSSETIAYDEEEDFDPFTTTDPAKREPTPCEVCKYFVTELQSRLDESAKSKAVFELGHDMNNRKRVDYLTSDLRLIEALNDPHICEKILEYNVHAERGGSNRYAKGQSETMGTLHNLVNKGVKVDLGIPYDLWDQPSAEVTKMQKKCFHLGEMMEEDIEEWYYNSQKHTSLEEYICVDRFLKDQDKSCLGEKYIPKKTKKSKSRRKKGDIGSNNKPLKKTEKKKEEL